ncbi:MAG: hypothetical protein ABSH46_14185 [Bryobacteraceae bacterium]|jgi:hypothetical protein
MFFRRKQPSEPTFEDRLGALRQAGFEAVKQPDGRIQVRKHGCAAMISEGHPPRIERAGWMMGERVAQLVDEGYQKFWDSGERQVPALASQLQALHEFEEDLRAALGVESLYNTSLGTTNDVHNYDRVEGR